MSWTHLRYDDPNIPLTQSDEDALLGLESLAPLAATTSCDSQGEGGAFAALRLNLTLGTSSYATMALRELTKQDTSAYHQTMLTAEADDQKAKPGKEETEAAVGEPVE